MKGFKALFRRPATGRFVGRLRTCDDTAIRYRMGAGFPGDVTRMTPMSHIEPCLIDATNPPLGYGLAVVVNPASQGVRQMAAGDTALTLIYGVTVRPWPFQQAQAAADFAAIGMGAGTSAPPTKGIIDINRRGPILVKVNGAPVKGGAVFVWVAATASPHVQGGFEAAASAGNTAALDARFTYNGAPDANGVCELMVNI